jgi:paired amphipathic helix protein Sin3a
MAGEPMQVEGEQRKQPEFDHARNYVKKIKMRFGSQPQVYKAFLEILHTFHREQHTIQDVYAQVAKLFANHPDLLSEFAQFLPDPNIHANQNDDGPAVASQQPRGAGRGGRGRLGAETPVPAQAAPPRPPRAQPPARARVENTAQETKGSYGTFEELSYFFRIKQALTDNGLNPQSDAYQEFLKCLMLFNQDIITRQELYLLVKELLRPYDTELLVWFRNFVNAEDSEPDEPMSVAEMDWSTAKKLGPSYREMPERVRFFVFCVRSSQKVVPFLFLCGTTFFFFSLPA